MKTTESRMNTLFLSKVDLLSNSKYEKNKPHKWVFKVLTRAGASDIMHDFEIYVGKGICRNSGLAFSGDIIIHLVSDLPKTTILSYFLTTGFLQFS